MKSQRRMNEQESLADQALLAYYDDRWFFMGEETNDAVVILGCLLSVTAFADWADKLPPDEDIGLY